MKNSPGLTENDLVMYSKLSSICLFLNLQIHHLLPLTCSISGLTLLLSRRGEVTSVRQTLSDNSALVGMSNLEDSWKDNTRMRQEGTAAHTFPDSFLTILVPLSLANTITHTLYLSNALCSLRSPSVPGLDYYRQMKE